VSDGYASRVDNIYHTYDITLTKISFDHPIFVKTSQIGVKSPLKHTIDVFLIKRLLDDGIWVKSVKKDFALLVILHGGDC
jgi:hypothetical protein